MTFDPSAELLAMARRWRVTVAEMEAMTEALRGQADELTLRQALGATERETPRDIAHRYPQGFQALLEGRGPLPGFGDQPLAHFTRDRVATWLPKYEQLVAAGKRARRRVHGPLAEGPREGAGAARQVVHALHAVGRLLAEVGVLRTDTVRDLKAPKPRGHLREPSLNERGGELAPQAGAAA